ncbi:MAG: hypothetical protein ACKODS_02835, partial [Methylophilaceae bacterium]
MKPLTYLLVLAVWVAQAVLAPRAGFGQLNYRYKTDSLWAEVTASIKAHHGWPGCQCGAKAPPLPAPAEEPAILQDKPCGPPHSFGSLCSSIDQKFEDKDPDSEFMYTFERLFYQYACVTETDPEEVKYEKIRNFWNKYNSQLICYSTATDIAGGHILKYAAFWGFDKFIIYVVRDYKVDLNFVELNDNSTVLDYVKNKMDKEQSITPMYSSLKSYYGILR